MSETQSGSETFITTCPECGKKGRVPLTYADSRMLDLPEDIYPRVAGSVRKYLGSTVLAEERSGS